MSIHSQPLAGLAVALQKRKLPGRGPPCPQEPCSDACPKHVKGGSSWLHRACSPPPPKQLLLPLTKSPPHRRQAPNHGPGSLPCARMASPCIKICSSDTGETHALAAIGFNRSKPSFELDALGRTSLPTFIASVFSDAEKPANLLLDLTPGASLSVVQQPPIDEATLHAVSPECGSNCSSSPCPAPPWLTRLGGWSINHPSEDQNGKKSSKVSDKLNRGHPTIKNHGAQPREVTLYNSDGCSYPPPRTRGTRRHQYHHDSLQSRPDWTRPPGKHMSNK